MYICCPEMKAASLAEIKRELKQRSPEELLTICLRLGRFKKENKELLTYLLFEAGDELSYIKLLKEDIDDMMEEIDRFVQQDAGPAGAKHDGHFPGRGGH